MNDRILEREEEEQRLAEEKAEEDRLAKEKFDREEKEREEYLDKMKKADEKRREDAARLEKEREEAEERWRNESELERLKEEIRKIEEEAKEIESEFVEEFEEEVPSIDKIEKEYQELDGVHYYNALDWILFFRWIINALFVGMPFSLYLCFTVIWNLGLNIYFNKWWAGFNFYLLLNTAYNLIQAWNALWLVFEVPVYLEWCKLIRVYSLESAVFYNLIYSWFAYQLYKSVWEYDYETMGAPSVFETFKDMYLIYNLILHFFILPINFMIISKEFEIEKIQLLSDWATDDFADDKYSLGEDDIDDGFLDFWWVLNPLNWIDVFWLFFFGYPFWDLFATI